MIELKRNPTRSVRIGTVTIGGGQPIAVQSMTRHAHAGRDGDGRPGATTCTRAGADVVRIAVDSQKDAEALAEIRQQTTANLSVDLQENYRLAEAVAPHVDKIRYNPGHLYHHEREKPWQDKVQVPRRRRRRARLRHPRRRELRQRRSGQGGTVRRGRFDSRRCWTAPGSIASCSTRSASRATASR